MAFIVSLLEDIQNDAGDAMDRSGQYTSDRIGGVIEKLMEVVKATENTDSIKGCD